VRSSREADRIPSGPKRAPGRNVVPESKGIPTTAMSHRPTSSRRGSRAKVAIPAKRGTLVASTGPMGSTGPSSWLCGTAPPLGTQRVFEVCNDGAAPVVPRPAGLPGSGRRGLPPRPAHEPDAPVRRERSKGHDRRAVTTYSGSSPDRSPCSRALASVSAREFVPSFS